MMTELNEYIPVVIAYRIKSAASPPKFSTSKCAPKRVFQRKRGTIHKPKTSTVSIRKTSEREVNKTGLPSLSSPLEPAETGNMVLTHNHAHILTKRPTSAHAAQ